MTNTLIFSEGGGKKGRVQQILEHTLYALEVV